MSTDPVLNEMDDDDGMPPLVDNPNPSMTFTFATNMTPIIFSPDPNSRFEILADDEYTPSPSPPSSVGPERTSHSKKRDASYIPRPPNAFILFRSSFIRAQHITEKIEGNRSTLSKIIGKYWKALPREEREVWEAKAITAQAEHRQRYPDWRFRPGANALAKVKDGPRNSKRNNRKGRGEAEAEERCREKRCAKIADLLKEGMKGTDLEVAVREWDRDETDTGQVIKGRGSTKAKAKGGSQMQEHTEVQEVVDNRAAVSEDLGVKDEVEAASTERNVRNQNQKQKLESARVCQTPDPNARFKVPLTAMFKRSSSAPASEARGVGLAASQDQTHAVPNSYFDFDCLSPLSMPGERDEHEGQTHGANDITWPMVESTLALPLPALASDQGTPFWTDVNDNACLASAFGDTGIAGHNSFLQYPPDQALRFNTALEDLSPIPDMSASVAFKEMEQGSAAISSYSSLNGWAGDMLPSGGFSPAYLGPPDPVVIVDNCSREAYPGLSYDDGIHPQYQAISHRPCLATSDIENLGRQQSSGLGVLDGFYHSFSKIGGPFYN